MKRCGDILRNRLHRQDAGASRLTAAGSAPVAVRQEEVVTVDAHHKTWEANRGEVAVIVALSLILLGIVHTVDSPSWSLAASVGIAVFIVFLLANIVTRFTRKDSPNHERSFRQLAEREPV